jgi:hypothetical protein
MGVGIGERGTVHLRVSIFDAGATQPIRSAEGRGEFDYMAGFLQIFPFAVGKNRAFAIDAALHEALEKLFVRTSTESAGTSKSSR